MRTLFCLLCLLLSFDCAVAQIKSQFKDQQNDNRTIVIKENGANDYQILDNQFGDAKVGEVIRITTNKIPEEKAIPSPRTSIKKPKPVPPPKNLNETPAPVKPTPEKTKPPVVKVKERKGPSGPSGIPGTYPVKDHPKGKKIILKRKKKAKKYKSNACFKGW